MEWRSADSPWDEATLTHETVMDCRTGRPLCRGSIVSTDTSNLVTSEMLRRNRSTLPTLGLCHALDWKVTQVPARVGEQLLRSLK